ncbi:L-fuculose-phosphate aldolase [Asanoa ferruginea]|uniref:L-fuculose-phosphate aldolase n=1 Tax=Asanoa ferruginea TaxID=53367 RepID=A0A3D9ZJ44_9ACTN|nr:class II aldolase/adducin family protein [Asanoa ferruginea]REF96492.1 L-fuculose-phosphate aldolase [Asanoa ferruginea]GIF50391.1 fuculose phosphate aldolase [Asanoa ferruginea]
MSATGPASPPRLDAGSEDERDLRDQLAQVGAEVVRAGLVVGSGGNLSARRPGDDTCWVTGAGTWLDRLDRPSFVRVRISDGSSEPGLVPSSEVALHLATYRARPDVTAIIHLHPQMALLLDALGERVRLLTTDHAFYVRRVGTVPFFPPGTAELAEAAAAAVADGTNCLILSRHGCSVLADSVELAHKRASNLEEAAHLTYRALALGRAADLTDQPPPAVA